MESSAADTLAAQTRMSDAVTLSLITTVGGILLAVNSTIVVLYVKARLARQDKLVGDRSEREQSELERLRKQTDDDRLAAAAELRALRLSDVERRQKISELEERCGVLETRLRDLEKELAGRTSEVALCNQRISDLLAILARLGIPAGESS
jgi:flagellar motility protein MotE (MotC chaperone)